MKAIAVINEMPEDCDECPLVGENCYCILLSKDAFPNEWVENAPYYSLKEKGDCPLKPMPHELDYASDWEDVEISFRQGWNACIKELEE